MWPCWRGATVANSSWHQPWPRQIAQRVSTLWWLKGSGTTLYMWVFFQFYFYLLNHHAYAVTTVQSTAVDHFIAFSPNWVWVYFSLWVYVSLPGALQKDWPSLLWHGVSALGMCVVGSLFYYFFPTTFAQPVTSWSGVPLGQILQSVDKPGNAFPSMHVAYALFACIWLRRELRNLHAPAWLLGLNILWCIAIGYSTLATKQHVLLDVLAGIGLGWLAGWLTTRGADWLDSKRGGV